jgi:hypothetical protein
MLFSPENEVVCLPFLLTTDGEGTGSHDGGCRSKVKYDRGRSILPTPGIARGSRKNRN